MLYALWVIVYGLCFMLYAHGSTRKHAEARGSKKKQNNFYGFVDNFYGFCDDFLQVFCFAFYAVQILSPKLWLPFLGVCVCKSLS